VSENFFKLFLTFLNSGIIVGMASDSKSGSDFGWVIIVLVIMFALWLSKGATQELVDSAGPIFSSSENEINNQNEDNEDSSHSNKNTEVIKNTTQSQYQQLVSLELGNAKGATEANSEYIVISANRRNERPINIGGWVLKNDPDRISYNYEGKAVKRRVLSLRLPKSGIEKFNPFGFNSGSEGPIILYPGERAVILSGKIPSTGNAIIKDNFRVNKCFGYIQDQTDYRFIPSFSNKCPKDDDLQGSEYLSQSCQRYINSRPSCHKPEFSDNLNYGTCVDRYCNLDSSCLAFVKKNYSYESCFNIHSKDSDFLTGEWRLFLNQVWELWPNKDETIYLYDSTGKLVDQLDY